LVAALRDNFKSNAGHHVLDITNEAMIRAANEDCIARYGHLDGLINNAASNPSVEGEKGQLFSRLENFDLQQWQQDMAVGLEGAFLCAKHFGQSISRNPKGGSILNIASDLALIAPDQRLYRKTGLKPDQQPVKPVTYSVVKSGLVGLTRYLATYWAEQGVRCNAICPGGVENGQPDAFIEKLSGLIPLGRMARPDEYQGTIVYLMSDASSYMTGSILAVDGGRSCW